MNAIVSHRDLSGFTQVEDVQRRLNEAVARVEEGYFTFTISTERNGSPFCLSHWVPSGRPYHHDHRLVGFAAELSDLPMKLNEYVRNYRRNAFTDAEVAATLGL